MIGIVVQYALYALMFLTIFAVIVGLSMTVFARKGYATNLEPPLAILHLIAATAPYIGLFGTVWHIIQALNGIAGGELSVGAISMPIGQALYATLWGLGCAIPALITHRLILLWAPDDEPQSNTGSDTATPEA